MSRERNSGNSGSRNSPSNDYGLPIQQIMEMGQLATKQLQNPIYNVAHRMAMDEVIAQWASSQPKEHAKRESLWHELQALGRVAQTMAGMVERAQQVAESQEREQYESEQDYLDRQGFGSTEQASPAPYQ